MSALRHAATYEELGDRLGALALFEATKPFVEVPGAPFEAAWRSTSPNPW